MSKHQLSQRWPSPVIVCDVAKFVGFMQFYLQLIPNFEIRITPLCDILGEDYSSMIRDLWTPAAQSMFNQMQMPFSAILAYGGTTIVNFLCSVLIFQLRDLAMLHASLRTVTTPSTLYTNVCKEASFDFMIKHSTALLHPVAFGCRCTHGNK
jgi:hypothetical protein